MMKYNKIVNKNEIKNTNTFLISCVCSIFLILAMCYFGINTNLKGTAAAVACSSGTPVGDYCCPSGYTAGVTSTGTCYSSRYQGGQCKVTVLKTEVANYTADGWGCSVAKTDDYVCSMSTTGNCPSGSTDVSSSTSITRKCQVNATSANYQNYTADGWSCTAVASDTYYVCTAGISNCTKSNVGKPYTTCSSYTDKSSCENAGCNYNSYLGYCTSNSVTPPNCSNGTTKTLCESIAGCTYTSSGCVPVNSGDEDDSTNPPAGSNENCSSYTESDGKLNCTFTKIASASPSCPSGWTGSCSKGQTVAMGSGNVYTCTCSKTKVVEQCYYDATNSKYVWGVYTISGTISSASSYKTKNECEGANNSTTTCEAGKYWHNGESTCKTCPAGLYCTGGGPGGEGINHCPEGTTSQEGSDERSDCKSSGSTGGGNNNDNPSGGGNNNTTCEAGKYWHNGESICKTCPAGLYCTGGGPGGEGINHCPEGTTSPEGSDSSSDCKASGSTGGGNNDTPSGGNGGTTVTKTFKATFNANGGTLNGSSSKSCSTSGSSCNITDLPTASKDGYVFKGWGTSSSCTSGSTSSLTLDAHSTYYACYASNSTGGNGNVEENPSTGEITIALVWFFGIFALAYSVVYFRDVKEK